MQEIREFVANGNYAATEGCIVALEMMLAEALDTIERYERALRHYECTPTVINGQRVLIYGDSGAIAREALNPKGSE